MTTPDHQTPSMPPQWKCGNEFAPYHPSASHVSPDYRDGWNHCYRAAQAVADERVREALAGVAAKLRRAGADLPAPPIKGTIPSAILSGLSIALALVELDDRPAASLAELKGKP